MSKEKQIEEMKKELKQSLPITDTGCEMIATILVDDYGYRKQSEILSEFLQMVKNICAYEERLSYETIEEGIKRQMASKGGAE